MKKGQRPKVKSSQLRFSLDNVDSRIVYHIIKKHSNCYSVAGSVGPYGACLHDGSEYSGHYLQGDNAVTHQSLVEWHRDRIQALQEGGVSLLAVETIPMSCEALAILDCIYEGGLLSSWISFTLRDEEHLAGGETVEKAIRQVKNHQMAR